jgi:carbon monoxide dehydrogenase subunit G
MDISGEYIFDVPSHMVWNTLQDPKVLEVVLPGAQGFQQVGENEYTGTLLIKVGPVQGAFEGKIRLYDFKAPDGYSMHVDGRGAPGVMNASGKLRLEERGRQTYLKYVGQAQVGGRIASVGQRLVENAAHSIIRQSLEALNDYLKIQMEQQQGTGAESTAVTANEASPSPAKVITQSAPVAEYEAPSQLASMLKKARDMVNNLIKPD